MKVLFVGDVYGQPGRRVVNDHLPLIAPGYDFVIVNAENSAGGFGIHYDAATRLLEAGADCLTLGNHAWDHKDIYLLLGQPDKFPVVRPLNYSDPDTPGMGWRTFEVDAGHGLTERLTVVNLLGRVFMGESANPFRAIDDLLRRDDLGSVFVDFHAETTSEKAAMGWHLDGRVAAVIGTHTHVATADTRILPGGTGFQTDAGFTGPLNSVIGARAEEPVQGMLTERRHRFQMGEGPAVLNGVALEISGGRCLDIERYRYEERAWDDRSQPPRLIRTGRLQLRAPSPADAEASLAAQLASRAELKAWMIWAQECPTLDEVRANLAGAEERFATGEQLRYHVWNHSGEVMVGSGFHALDWSVPKGEIGYWTATPFVGQGYALEVAQALTQLALRTQTEGGLGFRRLEIRCDPRNVRSRRIPERLGYRLDAQLVHDARSADGRELRDTLIYSLTR